MRCGSTKAGLKKDAPLTITTLALDNRTITRVTIGIRRPRGASGLRKIGRIRVKQCLLWGGGGGGGAGTLLRLIPKKLEQIAIERSASKS